MDDLGINKWLKDNYGTTVEGLSLFRLIWSTNVTEHRFSEFHDYYGDILLRRVRETREVLKYPFAQDRWVLERVQLIDDKVRDFGLMTNDQYHYEEIYVFQSKEGKFLPLNQQAVEAAMFLFFKFYLQMTRKERTDLRMELLARRELVKKQKIRELIGDGRAAHGFVLEGIKK